MRTRRRSDNTRILGVIALIGLLGLPITLGGHHHGTADLARNCSTCVVVHFSPVEVAAPVALPAVLIAQPLPHAAAPVAHTQFDLPAHPGRAPPTPLGDSAV